MDAYGKLHGCYVVMKTRCKVTLKQCHGVMLGQKQCLVLVHVEELISASKAAESVWARWTRLSAWCCGYPKQNST